MACVSGLALSSLKTSEGVTPLAAVPMISRRKLLSGPISSDSSSSVYLRNSLNSSLATSFSMNHRATAVMTMLLALTPGGVFKSNSKFEPEK